MAETKLSEVVRPDGSHRMIEVNKLEESRKKYGYVTVEEHVLSQLPEIELVEEVPVYVSDSPPKKRGRRRKIAR